MSARINVSGASGGGINGNYVLQEAISAYTDEAYTTAKKLSGTAIVGSNPNIDTSSETYIGQVKWYKPITPTINVASLITSTDGTPSTTSQDFLTYIKTVRTFGATKINLQQVVTQEDGLAKIGRDFAEVQSQDEHNAILSVLRGVALSEMLIGAGGGGASIGLGGQTFVNEPTSNVHGFFVDLGSAKAIVDASAEKQGAARAENFLQAMGMAWKDYEPDYAYLIASPAVMASLRSANLVDSDRVQDGNMVFQTIFNGKLRLIQTRAAQGFSTAQLTRLAAGAGVAITGVNTSFIVLPGALAMAPLSIPEPVEIQRAAAAYYGGGTTSVWHRWGYVLAPAGYNWKGSDDAFPSDADYGNVLTTAGAPAPLDAPFDASLGDETTQKNLTNNTTTPGSATAWVKGTWERKASSVLSLGILPVFHA